MGNGNNNNVIAEPTGTPASIATPTSPERTQSAKYRAPGPPPSRPSVLPKRVSDLDRKNNFLKFIRTPKEPVCFQ